MKIEILRVIFTYPSGKKESKFDRYGLFKFLQSLNYAPMVHYIPVHLLKYYRERFGFKIGDYPIAERFYEQAVPIPLYPSLTDSEVEKLLMILKDISHHRD